jgi:pantoate--beta-alanine ligase
MFIHYKSFRVRSVIPRKDPFIRKSQKNNPCLLLANPAVLNIAHSLEPKPIATAAMITLQTTAEIQEKLADYRTKGLSIGFVPTMGALHKGHISLIERAKAENHIVICSIFVNPTQFNDPKDLERYPRTLSSDSRMLEEAGASLLFSPDIKEIYPEGTHQKAAMNLGMLDKVMEGKQRPGHFEGVVQVVSRLFDIVQSDTAYFGQKDWQQVAVIREMVRQMKYSTRIIACPIIRESNGLAMSSRNVLLSPEERNQAAAIYQTLSAVKNMSVSASISELIDFARSSLSNIEGMSPEYFEIVDAQTLVPLANMGEAESVVACVAVRLGKVRLIDNMILK